MVQIDLIFRILKSFLAKQDVPVVEFVNMQGDNPYRILVAGVLSPRTNDKTTIGACKRLFAKAPDFKSLSRLSIEEIDELIYPVGFHKNKAGYLEKISKKIYTEFGGTIPDTREELMKLDGVGRKVANLVAATAFGREEICVDVHVHRIMNRIGYLKTNTPLHTEMELRKKLPLKYWKTANYLLVAFGQDVCRPVSPLCSVCPINKYCKRVGVGVRR